MGMYLPKANVGREEKTLSKTYSTTDTLSLRMEYHLESTIKMKKKLSMIRYILFCPKKKRVVLSLEKLT